mmetsp:Transcript_68121/g.134443  ORF Transcript_68121/g.134443 Transcript_68121/m.134443 type:complete len:398 (-) Transcript_68121:75-1268(-)
MAIQSPGTVTRQDTVQDLTEAARLRHVLERCLGVKGPNATATCSVALRRLAKLHLSKEAVRGLHLGRIAKQVAMEGPPTAAHDAEALCDLWRAMLRSGPLNTFCQVEARLRLEPCASDIAILVDTGPLLGNGKLEQKHRLQACMTLQKIAVTAECEQSLKSFAQSAVESLSVEFDSNVDQFDLTVASDKANALKKVEVLTAAATVMADEDANVAEADATADVEVETEPEAEAEVNTSTYATCPGELSCDPKEVDVRNASSAASRFEACCHGRAVILAVALRAQALKEGEMSLNEHRSTQQSSPGDSNDVDWYRFYDEGSGIYWWKHMKTGLSFSEGDPAWQKYKDPANGRRWWWHSFSGEWFYEPLLSNKGLVNEPERGNILLSSEASCKRRWKRNV